VQEAHASILSRRSTAATNKGQSGHESLSVSHDEAMKEALALARAALNAMPIGPFSMEQTSQHTASSRALFPNKNHPQAVVPLHAPINQLSLLWLSAQILAAGQASESHTPLQFCSTSSSLEPVIDACSGTAWVAWREVVEVCC